MRIVPVSILFLLLFLAASVYAQGYRYCLPSPEKNAETIINVIGFKQFHEIQYRETLLDIARLYGLGFNELKLLYPETNPWLPEKGTNLFIPTQWIIPPTQHKDIVINLPEMRLYKFFPYYNMIKTYPIAVGNTKTETPEGKYQVIKLETDPVWKVPKDLRKHYKKNYLGPGPDNPLGKYWIGLSNKKYGIHGTNFPWSIGRLVSKGCIRLYPEHIESLYKEVSLGNVVEIIYEPVKIGLRDSQIFIEVHPDLYGRFVNLEEHALELLEQMNFMDSVSLEAVQKALYKKNGVPTLIGVIKKGGDLQKVTEKNDRLFLSYRSDN